MKSSREQCEPRRTSIGQAILALSLASALGIACMAPALAKDGDRGHDKGWHRGEQRGERYDDRYRRERYYRAPPAPYYYSAPVYSPPPVYYPPQPSAGISLFFPLDFRR